MSNEHLWDTYNIYAVNAPIIQVLAPSLRDMVAVMSTLDF